MIQFKTLKTCSLVFSILCCVALVACLCLAVTLPTRSTYQTVFGTVTRTTCGYFDLDYLSSVILLAMGAFLGFSVYGSIHVEKKGKKVESRAEAVTVECSCSSEAKAEQKEPLAESVEPTTEDAKTEE